MQRERYPLLSFSPPRRKAKSLDQTVQSLESKTWNASGIQDITLTHCQMLNSEHHGNRSLRHSWKSVLKREWARMGQTWSWHQQHSHWPFSNNTHNFLMKRIQAFSMRRQCNLKISLEKKKSENVQKKISVWKWEGKKKNNEVAAVGKFTLSGDPVAVKMPETVTPEGRKIDRAGYPSSPERSNSESCRKSWRRTGRTGEEERQAFSTWETALGLSSIYLWTTNNLWQNISVNMSHLSVNLQLLLCFFTAVLSLTAPRLHSLAGIWGATTSSWGTVSTGPTLAPAGWLGWLLALGPPCLLPWLFGQVFLHPPSSSPPPAPPWWCLSHPVQGRYFPTSSSSASLLLLLLLSEDREVESLLHPWLHLPWSPQDHA